MKKQLLPILIPLFTVVVAVAGLLATIEQLSGGTASLGSKETKAIPSPAPSEGPAILPTPRFPVAPSPGIAGEEGTKTPAGKLSQDILALYSKSIPLGRPPLPHAPLLKVSGAAHTDFLRNFAALKYDGKVWQVEERKQPYNGEELAPLATEFSSAEKDAVSAEFLVKPTSGFLPVSPNLEELSATSPLLYYPDSEGFYSKSNPPSSYTFSSIHYRFTESLLNSAQTIDDERYLQLPQNITPRTRDLARGITQGFETPYQKVKAIEHYLQVNYEFDPSARKAPPGWEPTDWFLFEERRGTDVDFNSALAILARLVGVPTRLATGFAGLEQTSEEQIVYADQAHTWAEVGFKELGWVPFDATPPGPQPRIAEVIERKEEKGMPSTGKAPTFTQITQVARTIRKGSYFRVEGIVQNEKGKGLGGIPVEIFLGESKQIAGELIGSGETSNGHFEVRCWMPQKVKVGNYVVMAHALGSAQYSSSWSDPEVKVVAVTRLGLKLPEEIRAGQPLTIRGWLREEYGYPVASQEIEIWADGKAIGKPITSKKGEFIIKQTFDKPGKHTIKANFKGADFYLPCSTALELSVKGKGFPWWVLAFIPVSGGGVGGYLLYRRKRGRPSTVRVASLERPSVSATVRVQKKEGGPSLNLLFPQIKEPFPLVWGLGDELEIVLCLLNGQGQGISGRVVEIWAGEEMMGQLVTDEGGRAHLKHIFAEKGEYLIVGKFAGDHAYGEAETSELLRIVDYREELVCSFNLLLKWLRDQGISLPEGATPREIEEMLSRQVPSEKSLDALVSCFEEAEYSSHPIARGHYELMFLAQKRIKELYSERGRIDERGNQT